MAGSFELIFEQLAEGTTLDSIKDQLITDFEIDPNLIAHSKGKPVSLLRDLPNKTAVKYQQALHEMGVICKLELITSMMLSLESVDAEVKDDSPTDFTAQLESESTETFFAHAAAPTPPKAHKEPPKAPPAPQPPTETDDLPIINPDLAQPSKSAMPPSAKLTPPPPPPTPPTNKPEAAPSRQYTANDPPSIPPSEFVNEAIVLESAQYDANVETPASIPKYARYDDEEMDSSEENNPTPTRKKTSSNSKLPMLLGGGGLVVILIGIGAYFLLAEDPTPPANNYAVRTPQNALTSQQTVAPDNSQKLIVEATAAIGKQDFKQALELIKSIKSAIERDKLYQLIADQHIQDNRLPDAIDTAKRMSASPTQANLLSLLAEKYMAIESFPQAKELAKLIPGYTLQTATLSKIAIAETTSLSTQAREQAQQGNKTEAAKSFEQATRYAENINDLDSRIAAFSIIAIEQTKANQLDQAEDTITFIEKVERRAKTLSAMAGIVAQAGDKEMAQQLFKRAVQDANRIWDAREKSALIDYISKEREAVGLSAH